MKTGYYAFSYNRDLISFPQLLREERENSHLLNFEHT